MTEVLGRTFVISDTYDPSSDESNDLREGDGGSEMNRHGEGVLVVPSPSLRRQGRSRTRKMRWRRRKQKMPRRAER
jgi:hypothetical protein